MLSKLRLCLIAGVCSVGLHLQAQEADSLAEVTLVSPYSNSVRAPLTLGNFSGVEIRKRNYGQEPSLILAQTPSVTFYTDAGSGNGYSYMRLRGIDQTRLNMSLNGIPLNEPEDQGVFFSNYPDFLESVSAIQIQRGAGYSKSGTASYAGSLYLESHPFRDSANTEFSAGYGSFNTYRVNGSYSSGLKNGFGINGRASYLHSDGYKDHSANTSGSAFINAGYWGDKHKVYLLSFVGRQQNELAWIGSPLDSIKRNPKFNSNSRQEYDEFIQAHAQLHHEWKINDRSQLHTAVFYNHLQGNYDFDLNNFIGMSSTSELYNYNFKSHFAGGYSYYGFKTKNINWYTGIQAQSYQRRHLGTEKTIGELYTNTGYRNEASLFSKFILTQNRWSLLADIQYRYSSFTYKGSEQMPGQYWNFLNTTLGLNYSLHKNLVAYYSISNTNREPTRSDFLFGNDNLERDSNGELIFNPLNHERVIDQELGLKYFAKRGYVYGNIYYMRFRDEITLNGQIGPSGVPLHSSAAKSFRSGFEFDAMYRLSKNFELRNQSSISYNRIKEDSIKLKPVLTPGLIINQEIRYSYSNWQLGLTARYQGSSFVDYSNTTSIASFFILNLNGSIQFRKLNVFASLNNITNQKYYTNAVMTASGVFGYFVQAPVNFYTGFRIRL